MKFSKVWNWAQKLGSLPSIRIGHLSDPKEWVLVVKDKIQKPDNNSILGFSDYLDLSLASPFIEVDILKVRRLTEKTVPDYIMTNRPFGKILIEDEVVLDLREYTSEILDLSYDWYRLTRERLDNVIGYLEKYGLKTTNTKIDWELSLKNAYY